MRYYHVFENRVAKRVRVHDAACSLVEKRAEGPSQNKWHGPFGSRKEALRFAQSLRRSDTKECGRCLYDD